ncbi:hypothetical protein GZH53_11760 [Flavihumibacter sp. R14]|nr:hypothetical protein [Flavihumibacter soli]
MKVENLFHLILICFLGLMACSNKKALNTPHEKVRFSLAADSSAVEMHGLSSDVLDYLGSDSLGEKEWQSFFSVYPDHGDPELKDLQRPLAGQYLLKDSVISFVPAEEFKKDSVYFARFYTRNILGKPSDLVMDGRGLSEQAEIVEFSFKK